MTDVTTTKTTASEHITTTHVHGEPKETLRSNAVAIIGFVIVVVVVLWGLFHIATLGQPWLSSLFGSRPATIQVTAPSDVTSGASFTVSWKYATSEKGMYAFLYPCQDVLFDTVGGDGAVHTLPCGAAYTTPTNNSMILTPRLSGTATTSVPLTIIFLPSATTSKQVQGSATIAVHPGASPTLVLQPATSTKPVVVPSPVRPLGPTDLSVQILSVVPDGAGGGVATFDIGNIGQSSTGVYTFSAQLPTASGYLYSSPAQSSLAPGDHIVNTLRFSQAVSGIFSVVVDSSKNESNTGNNYASQQVSMPSYNYDNYPQQYPQYPQYPQYQY